MYMVAAIPQTTCSPITTHSLYFVVGYNKRYNENWNNYTVVYMEYTHTDSRHWLKNLFAESSNKGFYRKPMSVLKYILQYLSNPVEWNVDLDCKM